ncbi:MAG: tRNA 2-thiouridine(34) synthase MnmA [Ignavibacteriaceae bacterium]|nr:tRNA 2-thiouridine(34) synthase MnmA [Ignavibacteriaceae bacterium]
MKVALLISGGVDSSVALRLLLEQGYDVTAYYLKIWLQDDFSFLGDCPWEEDVEFASRVCEQAGVELVTLPMQDEYWASVVSYTIAEIKEGRTPNPDMFCNRLIKFGEFSKRIGDKYDKIASGHYARVINDNGIYKLGVSPDPVKDQTYFLAYVTQQQLSNLLFPIGEYDKAQIRSIADRYDLANKKRKDSQGICFLGRISFRDFIKQHLGELKGDIINTDTGKKMGEHNGFYFYTIGQRSGLGLSGGPWYVVQKDTANNIIYISNKDMISEKERTEFLVTKFNWITGTPPLNDRLRVKIRHGAKSYNCRLNLQGETGRVTIDQPEKGIAAGQFAVFYEDDICIGGSVIM